MEEGCEEGLDAVDLIEGEKGGGFGCWGRNRGPCDDGIINRSRGRVVFLIAPLATTTATSPRDHIRPPGGSRPQLSRAQERKQGSRTTRGRVPTGVMTPYLCRVGILADRASCSTAPKG